MGIVIFVVLLAGAMLLLQSDKFEKWFKGLKK